MVCASVQAAMSTVGSAFTGPPYGRRRGPPGRWSGRPGPPGRMSRMSVTTPATDPARSSAAPALGEISPTRAEFRELARDRRVIPVTRRLLADTITPVGLYATLCRRSARHVPAGVGRERSLLVPLVVRRGAGAGRPDRARTAAPPGSARRRPACRATATRSACCDESLRFLHTEPLAGLPPLTGGLVGYLGYDVVRRWERIDTCRVGTGARDAIRRSRSW